jgi:hypothetical protein
MIFDGRKRINSLVLSLARFGCISLTRLVLRHGLVVRRAQVWGRFLDVWPGVARIPGEINWLKHSLSVTDEVRLFTCSWGFLQKKNKERN